MVGEMKRLNVVDVANFDREDFNIIKKNRISLKNAVKLYKKKDNNR